MMLLSGWTVLLRDLKLYDNDWLSLKEGGGGVCVGGEGVDSRDMLNHP